MNAVAVPGIDTSLLKSRSAIRKSIRRRARRVLLDKYPVLFQSVSANSSSSFISAGAKRVHIHVVAVHGWHWRDSSNIKCDYAQLARAALRLEVMGEVRSEVEDLRKEVASANGGDSVDGSVDVLQHVERDLESILAHVVRISHTPLSGCLGNNQTIGHRTDACFKELDEPLDSVDEVFDISSETDRSALVGGYAKSNASGTAAVPVATAEGIQGSVSEADTVPLMTGKRLLSEADVVWFVAHSQGCVISMLLLDRLFQSGVLQGPFQDDNNNDSDHDAADRDEQNRDFVASRDAVGNADETTTIRSVEKHGQHICILSMAGVHQGTWETASALAVNRPATQEFYMLAKPKSRLFAKVYAPAVRRVLGLGVVVIPCAAFGDMVVTLQSQSMEAWQHPNIVRALFVHGNENSALAASWNHDFLNLVEPSPSASTFLLALSLLAFQLRNCGRSERLARFARSSASASTEVAERLAGIFQTASEAFNASTSALPAAVPVNVQSGQHSLDVNAATAPLPDGAPAAPDPNIDDSCATAAPETTKSWLFSAVSRSALAVVRHVTDTSQLTQTVKESHSRVHHTLEVFQTGAALCLDVPAHVNVEPIEEFRADNVPLEIEECRHFVRILEQLEADSEQASGVRAVGVELRNAVRFLRHVFYVTDCMRGQPLDTVVRRSLMMRGFGVSHHESALVDQLLALVPKLSSRPDALRLLRACNLDIEAARLAAQSGDQQQACMVHSLPVIGQTEPNNTSLQPGGAAEQVDDLPPQYPAHANASPLHGPYAQHP